MKRSEIKDELGACLEKIHVLGDFSWDMGEELANCVQKLMDKDFKDRFEKATQIETTKKNNFKNNISIHTVDSN